VRPGGIEHNKAHIYAVLPAIAVVSVSPAAVGSKGNIRLNVLTCQSSLLSECFWGR